jgi:ABC-type sugar transport system ATPase subunit
VARVLLKNLTKQFGKKTVVDHLNLEVRDGEFVALFGLPGAGKTTILRMIAGLETVTAGEIWIGDTLVNNLSPAERDVAMVFQSFALYPTKTVYENLAFPLKKRKMTKEEIDHRVKEVAEMLRIDHLLGKLPAQLSGGEKQRVALGRAIVRRPKVFLFDEPLTNLDAKLRLHMRAELKKIQRELGQTAIFSTPDELEAISMADRVAVIREGRLIQYDTVDNVYDHPRNLFVARNIGSPSMNLIEGELAREEGRLVLRAGALTVDLTPLKEHLSNYNEGDTLLLGVRPTDIVTAKERPQLDNVIEAEVDVIEPLGAEIQLTLQVNGVELITLVPQDLLVDRGERVWIGFSTDRIHLFDKKTEETIL